jgi:hypothetical protein
MASEDGSKLYGLDTKKWDDEIRKVDLINDAHDGVNRSGLSCLDGAMENGETPPTMGGRHCFLKECF